MRAQCVRTGVRDINVSRDLARISPIGELPASASVRLKRLHPRALTKPDLQQLILPTKGKNGALLDFLITFFEEVVPEAPASVESTAS